MQFDRGYDYLNFINNQQHERRIRTTANFSG